MNDLFGRKCAYLLAIAFLLTSCGNLSANNGQQRAESSANSVGAFSETSLSENTSNIAGPNGDSANPEPVYTLEASNATTTVEPCEITAGDYFMEWYVAEAEYHPQAGEAYPMFVFARFTADNISLTGKLIISEDGMDGIATFYPNDESLERLPCITMIDAHIGATNVFFTGIYEEDFKLYSELGTGTWEDATIKIDSVFLAIHAPSYSKNIHTVEVIDLGVKVSEKAD